MANQSKRKSANRTGQKNTQNRSARKSSSQVRIVAGQWGGRKIAVLDSAGLRPTGDRVRETLFNWLQLELPGKRCLDLFAGSGALGIEAASRGAGSVMLVESSKSVAAQLQKTIAELDASRLVSLFSGTAHDFLETKPEAFDIVFMDPPFAEQLHEITIRQLSDGYLTPGALMYVELPTSERDLVDTLPDNLSVIKDKTFGEVTVLLLEHG